MPEAAENTAYYLNTAIPAVALVSKGVRFPSGTWRWVADASALAWHVEEMLAELFPALQRRRLRFALLTSDFDVEQFERTVQALP